MSSRNCSLEQMLLSLPCHFTWEELELGNVARPVEPNIDSIEEHIQQTIKGTEVESYNLMGFYKTQMKSFQEARENFEKALNNTNTNDEKIVSLACQAWLTWKEQTNSNSTSEDEILTKINEVKQIIRGRQVDNIPEVMAEKAYSIAYSGFAEKGFEEALVCIDKALEAKQRNGTPDKLVTLMFTKVFVMHRLFKRRMKYSGNADKTVDKINELWKKLIAMLKELLDQEWGSVYGQTLIQYALFQSHINRDYGASGRKYAEEAEKVAASSDAVMRNVANYYLKSAGSDQRKRNKAEGILKKIIESKPCKDAAYKELALLGQLLVKKYKLTSCEETFVEAEECLRMSWNTSKKHLVPVFDLIDLYEARYKKNDDVSVLAEPDKIFRDISLYVEILDSCNQASMNSLYGNFLKNYGSALASYHHGSSRFHLNDESESGNINKLEEASQLLIGYTEDQDDEKLLRAAQIFKVMYSTLEQQKDPVQARFHQDYGDFLNKYSSDLALCYFVKSLECNPNQRREDAYEPLQELAWEKTKSSNKEEQVKGHKILENLEKESKSDSQSLG